ncbi:hypothetical protein R6Q59_030122 [Mikania micrantha]
MSFRFLIGINPLVRLPTKDALAVRGIWLGITNWCRLHQPIYAFSVKDMLHLHQSLNVSVRKKEAFHVVVLTAFWFIWKARNEAQFRGRRCSFHSLLEEIKALSYFWINNRTRWGSMTREQWNAFSFC